MVVNTKSFIMEKMTSFFTKICLVTMFVFAAGSLSAAQAQSTVSGTVKDSQGAVLPGVAVMVSGTNNGTVTDIDGKYQVSSVPTNGSLVYSFIGYELQTVAVNGRSTIDVTLIEESIDLSEVVAVGYGTMKKSDISGSVATVDRETMMKRVPANVGQALQGAAAGVMVTMQDGSPDGASAIRIRGVGTINGDASPLYVVDGVQVGNNADFVNPADIQSIEILKDASATAIYGSAGANGVVMITTSKGTKGKSNITLSADWGIQTLPYKLDVLDPDTYAKALREARLVNDNTPNLLNGVFDAKYDGKRNTIDWQDVMLQNGIRQQYTISTSGGNEKTTFALSAGFLDVEGLVINTNFKRFTARASVNTKVNKYFEFGGDINFSHRQRHGSNMALGNNQNMSSLRDFASMTPTLDYLNNNDAAAGQLVNVNLENPDGTFGTGYQNTPNGWEGNTTIGSNPYASQMENGERARNGRDRIQATGYVNITFFDNKTHKLDVRTQGTFNASSGSGSDFTGGRKRYNNIGGKMTEVPLQADQTYQFSLNNNNSYSMTLQTYLTYQMKTDMHELTLMGGNEVSKSWGQWINGSARKYAAESVRSLGLTEDTSTKTVNGAYNADVTSISYFGRLSYVLMNRYILTGTIRRDGSSNFAEGNRWGVFPSVAGAWRISEESFLKDNEAIQNLKLRIGWGQTGNAGGVGGKGIAQLKADAAYFFYPEDGVAGYFGGNPQRQPGFYAPLVDVNLKWETTTMTNFGLDVAFLENWDFTLDYFIKNTTDLLLNRQIRPTAGYTQVYTNYGEIQNSGLEVSLGYRKQVTDDFSFNVRFNASTLKNEVIEMGEPLYSTASANGVEFDGSQVGAIDGSGFWNNHSICKEGEVVGSFYGYVADGIIQDEAELAAYKKKLTLVEESEKIDNNGDKYIDRKETYQDAESKVDNNHPLAVGDMKYKDLNNDGKIDQNDRQILGNGIAKFNYGLSLGANYKDFDFNIYMYGVLGQDILSYSAMKLSTMVQLDDQTTPNILKEAYDDAARVQGGKATGSLPRLSIGDYNRNGRVSDLWVKNGNFLRISNVQVGYTLPANLSKALSIERARLYLGVNNLLVISPYKKYGDPEVGAGSVLYSGLDTGRYPQPRTFMGGLSITF